MQIGLIILGCVLLLIILLAFLPLRLQLVGGVEKTANLLLRLHVGPFLKIKLLEFKDKELKLDGAELRRRREEKQAAKAKKAAEGTVEEEKLPPLAKEDIMELIPNVMGRLTMEKLDISVSLSGNPHYCGLACGALWVIFGTGFGWLSHRLRKFTAEPKLDFGVDLTKPWSVHCEIVLLIRLKQLPGLGFKVLGMLIKNKKEQKKAAVLDAAAA